MSAKHTPGPWTRVAYNVARVESDGIACITVADCRPDNGVACYRPTNEDECVANARLIAAAPELLEALERIAAYGGMGASTEVKGIARAAIAKAREGDL